MKDWGWAATLQLLLQPFERHSGSTGWWNDYEYKIDVQSILLFPENITRGSFEKVDVFFGILQFEASPGDLKESNGAWLGAGGKGIGCALRDRIFIWGIIYNCHGLLDNILKVSAAILEVSAEEKEEPPLNSTVHQEFMMISWPSITTCFGQWHFVFTRDAYISFSKKDHMRSQHHAGQRRQITVDNAASFVCIVS